MEFKKDALIFGTGEENQPIQLIKKVNVVPQDGKNLYMIYYLDPEGGESPFSFIYDAAGGVITLKNQEEIEWKKTT